MTVEQMRERLIKVYPGPSWQYKVMRMPDYQVIRVHSRFMSVGKFDEIAKKPKPAGKQLSIFDADFNPNRA